MKKLALLVVLVVVFALMGGVALAAETPHGPFDNNSAVCAACHRAHTSSAEYLLATPRVTGLCIVCHDGSGADTDVVNGVYVVNGTELDKNINRGDVGYPAALANGYNHNTWGSATYPLMGGGFTNLLYGGGSTATSSKHMNPAGGTAATTYRIQFGSAVDSTNSEAPGRAKNFLDCVDCHMPHRSTNYRMLRVQPTGYSGANLVVPFQGISSGGADNYPTVPGRRYTEDTGMFNTRMTGSDSISKWCGLGCHNYYYRNAVRMDNGHQAAQASPAMSTRTATTYTANTAIVQVLDASNVTVGQNMVSINGLNYNVTLVNTGATPDEITISPVLVATPLAPVYAGTVVKIAGKGMEVYYDLDNSGSQDASFMHAIDVDLSYFPRNGSSGEQDLSVFLGNGNPRFNNLLPVADQDADRVYDKTDILTCLTCHRAHGTDVTMGGEAAIGARTIDGVSFPSGSDSMLLRLENRAVCQQCHAMPTGF